jgi:hypothetical protein
MGCGNAKQQVVPVLPEQRKKEKTVVFKEPPVDVINYIQPIQVRKRRK